MTVRSFMPLAAPYEAGCGLANPEGGQQYTTEQEANEFAGRLLGPPARLHTAFDHFASGAKSILPNWFTSPDPRHGFAESARRFFEVYTQVIEIRLDREGIWSAS